MKGLTPVSDELFAESLLPQDQELISLAKTSIPTLNRGDWVTTNRSEISEENFSSIRPRFDLNQIITQPLSYSTLVDVTDSIRSHE
jgi:hypothetical protein